MDKEDGESWEFCESCHIGSVQPCWATYARWHDGQFVIVPRVPAWRCDFCGDTYYDDEAMVRLAMLLGPESDLEDERRWRTAGLEERGEASLGSRRRV